MHTRKLAATIIPLLLATPLASAHEAGDWIVRGGLTTVAPDESSSNIMVGGTDLGVGLTVDNNTQLGLNVAYFLTDRINVELLAATPFTHDVNFSVTDPLGTGNKLGEVTHLPPTVSVNYYLNDPSSAFQPYVGAGVNFTIFFDEEFTSANEAAGLDDLSLDNSFGLSAQVGFDYQLNKTWHVNASVRYIDINTEASFNLSGTEGSVADIDINPWVYTVSVGYTF
ncbi:OmpW family outer membrane protein [Alteromonas sp. KUL49]|uniref:OmpW family outer membrane protein n=1 Tax=Alteromonas sp. KUL49 TaxID=2480798 RepID=UPI00102EF93E|nr:OmpW family outer membrane protein [Alteromonas sp. KUL49]TAP42053.1 outer membrane protein OmpW [Alteromonas sp. KUL49]GEA09629.1 outer membrane protein OmpW [Alteromonas sp. KUL49]